MTLAAIENNHIKKRDKGAETVTMKNATTQQQSSIEKKTRRRSLHVEAIIQPTCPASLSDLRDEIKTFVASIGQSSLLYRSGPVELKSAPPLLKTNCVEISVVDLENDEDLDGNSDPSCQIDGSAPTVASSCVSQIEVHAYVLCNDEAEMEELEHADEEDLTACETLQLPNSSLHGLWDSLILPRDVKRNLLEYAHSALLFSDVCVSPNIINWNRVVLLHGPPGTGKTSLCRALAHKLSIRMSERFPAGGFLLEIHSHSLFSKWFSESGKLISRLFNRIREMVEDNSDALVCVLVDEVESLAASRTRGIDGKSGEPSDAIRAVNSMLTQLDRIKKYKNVIVMTTTNLTGSVDVAFIDRADIKQFIGLPIFQARYEIFRSCCKEMVRVGLVKADSNERKANTIGGTGSLLLSTISKPDAIVNVSENHSLQSCHHVHEGEKEESNETSSEHLLFQCSEISSGLSGRTLRKLPFQSHAMFIRSSESISMTDFLEALKCGIENEQKERKLMGQ